MFQKGLAPILIVLLIAILVASIFTLPESNQTTPPQQTTQPSLTPIVTSAPSDSAQNNISIEALNEGIKLKNLNSQNYTIEGYVININDCSCPKGVLCSPCLPEILVSEDKQNTTIDSKTIYIRTDNPKDFQLGKQYRFSILLPMDREKQGFSYERKLVGYELIK